MPTQSSPPTSSPKTSPRDGLSDRDIPLGGLRGASPAPIQPFHLLDISDDLVPIDYNDDELVIVDNVRDIPDFENYKITFNVIVLCVSGEIHADVGGVPTIVHAQQTFICRSYVVLTNLLISPDFECKVVCVSDRLLKTILREQVSIWNDVLYRHHSCIIDIKDIDYAALYTMMRTVWKEDEMPFRREMLISLLRSAFLGLCGIFVERRQEQPVSAEEDRSRMEQLFHRFLDSVAKRKVKKRSVADYAAQLCITPKYLSAICRKCSGKSPVEWVNEYVIEDILFYLKSTDLSVKQIASELGFATPSFFGRFVREHLGTTPRRLRMKS